jgi:hypothetical protein
MKPLWQVLDALGVDVVLNGTNTDSGVAEPCR